MKERIKVKNLNNDMAITLIAMVITIIVLLILAGVSITTLSGENSLLNKAGEAKAQSEIAEVKDRAQLDILNWQGDLLNNRNNVTLDDEIIKEILAEKDYISGFNEEDSDNIKIITKNGYEFPISDLYDKDEDIPPQTGGDEAIPGKIVTGENKNYTNNGTAKIPVGFMIVPGAEDVSKGLVISDNPEDTEVKSDSIIANGNQFVWIPVTSEKQYERNRKYTSSSVSAKSYTDKGYLPAEIQPDLTGLTTDIEIGLKNEEAERTAVINAGGFYISRYEAGKEKINETYTLVSKKGKTIWTNISQETTKTTILNATEKFNSAKVKSALCTGIQWDVTMNFITNSEEKDGKGQPYDVITASPTRHIGADVAGQNEADRVCNIYDLEGNYYEYVAEKNTYNFQNPYVGRGGAYDNSNSASCRSYSHGNRSILGSFRITLYVI